MCWFVDVDTWFVVASDVVRGQLKVVMEVWSLTTEPVLLVKAILAAPDAANPDVPVILLIHRSCTNVVTGTATSALVAFVTEGDVPVATWRWLKLDVNYYTVLHV